MAAESDDAALDLRIEPKGWCLRIPAGEPLLTAARTAGIALPSSCRNGTCRACLCRLQSGRVAYRIEWPGLSAEEKQEGLILPCVAHALSDVVVEVPGAARAIRLDGEPRRIEILYPSRTETPMSDRDTKVPTPQGEEFVISRSFDAPRALVFKVWTERAHLMQWFGPAGVVITKADLDLRVGGGFHYGMRMPNGAELWGKWVFREIAAPDRLVLVSAFSDADGVLTRHPMSATWPMQTLSITSFVDLGARTEMTVRWSALDATDEERHTFDTSHAGMQQGWAGTLSQLTAYLATLSSLAEK